MAIVKIPSTANPFRVIVNGVEYIYAAGETVDVPESVATVIEQYIDAAEDMAAAPELPQGGTALGGADWNAAEDQPGHVLNRTHWAELNEGVMLPESEGVYTETDFGNGFMVMGTMPKLILGQSYEVSYNGVKYETIARRLINMQGMTALGNLGAAGAEGEANTGEPFVVLELSPEYQAMGACVGVMPLDGAESVRVSIAGEYETVHKLDEKYLPIQSSGNSMLINLTVGGSGYVADKSYEQICAHVGAGGDAYVSVSFYNTTMRYPFIGKTETEVKFGGWAVTLGTLDIQTISIDNTNSVSMAAFGVNIDAFN